MKNINILLLIVLTSISLKTMAQGDLLIAPMRIVFEGNKQKEELSLVNIGKDTATYSVSFLQYNMTEEGSFKTINKTDSAQMFADPYLRVFPRKVVLAPNEAQVVRVQYIKNSEMADGEYRSHLYFRAANYQPLGISSLKDTAMMAVKLTPVFGLSIPIIIRKGESKLNVNLSNLNVSMQSDSIPNLKFTVNRTGNISVFGNFVVEFVPANGKTIEIGALNGISVYTNINRRNVTIRLNKAKGINLKSGKIRVRYSSPADSKYVLFAESEI